MQCAAMYVNRAIAHKMRDAKMLTLGQIVALLADRKLDVVAAKSGVHRNTLAAIRDGRNANPTLRTIEALSDYFAAQCDGICK